MLSDLKINNKPIALSPSNSKKGGNITKLSISNEITKNEKDSMIRLSTPIKLICRNEKYLENSSKKVESNLNSPG